MTFVVSAAGAQAWRRLRLTLLTISSMVMVHELDFRIRYGLGSAFDQAMADSGHGAWWGVLLGGALVGAVGVALAAAIRHQRLWAQLRQSGGYGLHVTPARGLVREWLDLWFQMGIWVSTLFLFQENLEHLASEGHLAGLEPLLGDGAPVVWGAILIVTALVAAAGSIVRWHEASLRARILLARRRYPRPRHAFAHKRWLAIAAELRQNELHARHLLGRAPPLARSV